MVIILKIKSNKYLTIASIFFVLLCTLTSIAISFYKKDNLQKVNLINSQVPYENESFCLSIVCENVLIFTDFKTNNTNIYCVKFENTENKNIVLDNIDVFAKNNFNLNVNKQSVLSYNICEEIINICGGVTILNELGEEKFIHGNEFVKILQNETNNEYISYMFGVLLKTIFEQEQFVFLYDNSNISYIDIVNNKENIKKSLSEFTCLKCEAIKKWEKFYQFYYVY